MFTEALIGRDLTWKETLFWPEILGKALRKILGKALRK